MYNKKEEDNLLVAIYNEFLNITTGDRVNALDAAQMDTKNPAFSKYHRWCFDELFEKKYIYNKKIPANNYFYLSEKGREKAISIKHPIKTFYSQHWRWIVTTIIASVSAIASVLLIKCP